jgi:16S rRNA (cytosine1402-N4)-methyltransferase
MRSPSIDTVEDTSSALYFPPDRVGCPPDRRAPIEGLRMHQTFTHEPVMAEEVVELFAPVPPGVVVDATVGGGGHAAAILAAHPHLQILGLDRDPSAVQAASERLARFGDRARVVRGRFDSLREVVQDVLGNGGDTETPGLSGVLFDLGVSSPQLDRAERGFSYRQDAPLDMRMDPDAEITAADLANTLSVASLTRLFADNGEGRFARRLATAVVAARPLETTGQLSDVVRAALPAAVRRQGGHPARRVFQALRVAVNEELEQLDEVLPEAIDLLAPRGRCVVIAYHSGEDRLVKAAFGEAVTGGCACPPSLPCGCGAIRTARFVFRGSRQPRAAEVACNRRAESARLRAVERIGVDEGDQQMGGV